MDTSNIMLLASLALFGWYAWSNWLQPMLAARADSAVGPEAARRIVDDVMPPVADSAQPKRISAKQLYLAEQESIAALLVLRDKMEAIGASQDDVDQILALAPRLLSRAKAAAAAA